MTSREDFGRLAHAAYCDMAGRPAVWESLGPRAQAAWIHVATTIRDRLALGMSHGYRPDEAAQATGQAEESAMGLVNKSNAHGGSEDPTITGTDDAELYASEKAAGNEDVRWDGEGPAPDAEPEHVRVEREQREREELDAKRDAEQDARDGVSRGGADDGVGGLFRGDRADMTAGGDPNVQPTKAAPAKATKASSRGTTKR